MTDRLHNHPLVKRALDRAARIICEPQHKTFAARVNRMLREVDGLHQECLRSLPQLEADTCLRDIREAINDHLRAQQYRQEWRAYPEPMPRPECGEKESEE